MGVEVTGNDVLDAAAKTLLDESGVRWLREELEEHLLAGIRTIVGLKPDTGATHTDFECVAGTKQAIPAGHILLLDVVRNLAGTKRAITQVERSALDASDPDWHGATASGVIENYVADKRDPKVFYVNPPAVAGTGIEIVTSALPVYKAENLEEPIPLDDLYRDPLHHFVCAYAYAKNTKRQDLVKAQLFFGLFNNLLGLKGAVQLSVAPFLRDQSPQGQTPETPT